MSASIILSRRRFLQALAALGATVAMPAGVSLAQADEAQIDAAWSQAQREPWFFEVNEHGTIVDPDVREPSTRGDVWSPWDRRPRDPEHLISEIESIEPLISEFQIRAEDNLDDLRFQLDQLPERSRAARRLRLTIARFEAQPDDGWKDWIRQEGEAGIDRMWQIVERWLAEDIPLRELDWLPEHGHGMGRAYSFFRNDVDQNVLDTLGVVVIEGEHPGSSYYAAELRNEIVAANEVAVKLELPFRFRAEIEDVAVRQVRS